MNSFRLQANAPDPNPTPNPWLKDFDETYGFNSEAEMVAAMSDERYSAPGQAGEHYRELVTLMVKQSDFSGAGNVLQTNEGKAAARKAELLLQEDKQILREHAASLFNDPRYSTSALFRRQVREQIAANPHLADMIAPQGPTVKKFRLALGEEDLKEVKKMIEEEKAAEREQNRKDAIERAVRDAERPYIDVTGMDVSGEDNDE
jgi:hypothetical protein